MSTITKSEAAREARLRRQARRQGVGVAKSRSDGTFAFFDPNRNAWITSPEYGLSLDEAEEWLASADA